MPARIHSIPKAHLEGQHIEDASLAQIRSLVPQGDWSEGEWRVACRMVHTCGDPGLAQDLVFQNGAIEAGIEALRRGAPIYVDAQMQKAGISLARLRQLNSCYTGEQIMCHVADADVAERAREERLARSLFALRKAAPRLEGAIVSIGNAPVALLELNRLIQEEGLRPALVLGFPVGFVHVEESKEELATLPVPSIVLTGRRGGSALGVAALHAIALQGIQNGEIL